MLRSLFISRGTDLGVNRQGKWAGEPLTYSVSDIGLPRLRKEVS